MSTRAKEIITPKSVALKKSTYTPVKATKESVTSTSKHNSVARKINAPRKVRDLFALAAFIVIQITIFTLLSTEKNKEGGASLDTQYTGFFGFWKDLANFIALNCWPLIKTVVVVYILSTVALYIARVSMKPVFYITLASTVRWHHGTNPVENHARDAHSLSFTCACAHYSSHVHCTVQMIPSAVFVYKMAQKEMWYPASFGAVSLLIALVVIVRCWTSWMIAITSVQMATRSVMGHPTLVIVLPLMYVTEYTSTWTLPPARSPPDTRLPVSFSFSFSLLSTVRTTVRTSQ